MEKTTNASTAWEEKQPRKLHFDTSDVELTKLEIASGKCSQIVPNFEKNSRLVLLIALLGFTVALLGFVPSPELPKCKNAKFVYFINHQQSFLFLNSLLINKYLINFLLFCFM